MRDDLLPTAVVGNDPQPDWLVSKAELERCAARQIPIEAAQPGLDPAVLASLGSKTAMVGATL